MLKPPVESLLFQATRRMLWWLIVFAIAVLIPTVGADLAREFIPGLAAHASGPRPAVPELGWTPESGAQPQIFQVRSDIPDQPGPNQKRAGTCNPKAAQVEIKGGCWVKTETPPPCPEGIQWEHEGRCYLPVAPAAKLPTSGGNYPVNVAGE